MRTKTPHLFLILFIISLQKLFAQDQRVSRPGYVDSLRRELRASKSDTTKIKLQYEISEITGEGFRVSFWDSMVNAAHTHHLPLIECQSLNNLGYLYQTQNDIPNFIKCMQKGMQIAEAHRYDSVLFILMAGLGNQYVRMLQLKKGLDLCFRGLKLAEKLKDKYAILAFNSIIASAYSVSGDYNKTLEKRLENLKIYTELKDSFNICFGLISIANTYAMIDDLDKVSEYYFKSFKFFKPTYGSGAVAAFYNSIGSAHQIKKRYDSADYYLHKSYELSKSRGAKTAIVSSLVLIAKNNYFMGRNGEAKKQAMEALQLCKELNFRAQLPDLALTLKWILVKDKNFKEALEAYELSVATRDSLSNEKNRQLASEKEFDYEFEKKENENKLLAQQNQIQGLKLRQTNYFLLGMGAVLILVFIIGVLVMRQNKIRSDQVASQLEHKLLRSQMNPHFIFNSLQAIQNFILKHDEREAVRYLSSFAAVTRNVLENSRMEAIPLKKEIALLENYLQLQKLRFKNRFEYEILVDGAIDSENTFIPPMLSQPFIENSVEHGFHGIEGGKIWVSYTVHGNQLLMEIMDNGIGMKEEYQQGKQHRSLALEITRERVALMKKKAGGQVIFDIVEAFPLQERKGVRVSFSFPLNFQLRT